MNLDVDGLRELSRKECLARVSGVKPQVGRVVFVHDGYPVALPVNYRVVDGQVVFRTGIGSKLDAAVRGEPVSFEVDAVDASWLEGWSVLIKGKAEELTGEQREHADRLGLEPWASGSKARYLTIREDEMTGREIV